MIRQNNDSFFDYGPSKGVNSYETVPERSIVFLPTPGLLKLQGVWHIHAYFDNAQDSQHISETYILNTRHPTISAASSISQENSNSEKGELYDPYDPGSSESESESQNGSEDHHSNLRSGFDSPASQGGLHDDSTYSQPQGRSHQPTLGPSARSMPTPGAPLFPLNAYGGRGANGRETSTDKNLSKQAIGPLKITPPRLKVDYQHQSAFCGSGVDHIKAPSEITRKRSRGPSEETDQEPFTCDLCAVQLSKAKALEEHLESRSHWEILEHIQQQNKYDDRAIAFLHEAMLHKIRQDNWVMDDKALEALQEKDYMTKQEMLQCAACKVYVSMSVASVQNHLSSQDHLRNKEEFRMKQRRECVTTAETMMKQLTPQYANFLEGKDPFN